MRLEVHEGGVQKPKIYSNEVQWLLWDDGSYQPHDPIGNGIRALK